MTRGMRLAVTLWPWLLTAVIVAPLMAPGFVLSYDMVFVPDLAMRPDFLGFGTSLPRAVPSDAVVAVVDELIPGMLLQKLVLVAALVLAGIGARRLVPGDSGVAQLAATSLYVWNPYVAERLGIGHWPTLLAYAALPWVLDAARRLVRGSRTGPELVLWMALAALSASGGVMALVMALLATLERGANGMRRMAFVLGVGLAVNAPWVVAGLLHRGGAVSDPVGVEVFAARGEGVLPAPLAALGLGGIWNHEVVPVTRLGGAAAVMLVVVVVVSAFGLPTWIARLPRGTRFALVAAGLVGLAVALAGVWATQTVQWWVSTVPGGGLIRDGARFLALLAPLQASLFGMGAAALARSMKHQVGAVAVVGGAALAPIALMPDLAWGLAGQLTPVDYPEEYAEVRELLVDEAGADAGRLLVLPFSSYRQPSWNHDRRVLDPLGRYLPLDYTASDVLFVSGEPVQGEDVLARRVTAALAPAGSAADVAGRLADLGMGWVVLDREAQVEIGADALTADLPEGMRVHSGPGLALWALPGPSTAGISPWESAMLVAAWVAATGTVGAAAVILVTRRVSRARVRVRPK